MTDEQFHAHRTTLANNFATAGAELLEYMRAPGTLAAIPNTSPEQYVVAGDLTAIQALLPNRRERRGQRPNEDLHWGPVAGQPRRWTILITEAGKGVVSDYGYSFPDAKPDFERVDVVELAGIANKAAEEGELPEGMVIAPHYRGFARLGIGAYVINHTANSEPAELVISTATEEEKAGRVVGDNRDNPAGHMLQPEAMAVRLCFENVAGLDALEDQLTMLREVHFPESIAADRAARAGASESNMQKVHIPSARVGAVQSIDTPEFQSLLKAYRNSTIDFAERKAEFIAHIDQHVASQVRAVRDELEAQLAECAALSAKWAAAAGDADGRALNARNAALEEAAKVPRKYALDLSAGIFGARYPDEATHICNASTNMGDAIRALKAPAISHSGEGEKGGAA
jgi:hypothetical protein